MRALVLTIISISVLLTAQAALAFTSPHEKLDDPQLSARAEIIAREIRCVVCQNQSIHDSESEIAQGLRTLIAVQLKEGRSNEEIITYIHERYGDYILMTPPVKPATWFLWFGPILIFILGGYGATRMLKQKPRRPKTKRGRP